jgi:hypothetical protein
VLLLTVNRQTTISVAEDNNDIIASFRLAKIGK